MNPLASTFLLTLVLSFAVLVLLLRPAAASKSTRERLLAIQDSFRAQIDNDDGSELKVLETQNYAARLGVLLDRFSWTEKFKVLLVHAGSSRSVGAVAFTSAGCAAVPGVVCFLLTGFILPSVIAGAVGFAVPYAVLRILRSRRVKAFNIALPDSIDLLARSLRAGHSVGSGIEMVGEQAPEPLGSEFVQVFQQQRLGLPFRDALPAGWASECHLATCIS